MGCGFLVSSNVVNQLLMLDLKGNIGSIKNAVKLSCASAFCREKAEPVRVKIRDLSDHYRFERGKTQIQYITEAVLIDKEWSPKKGSGPKGGKDPEQSGLDGTLPSSRALSKSRDDSGTFPVQDLQDAGKVYGKCHGINQ